MYQRFSGFTDLTVRRFDSNGDPVDSPFTFVRMVDDPAGEGGLRPQVDRVVLARSSLLRAER